MSVEISNYNDYVFLTKKYLRNYNKFKLTAKVLEEDIQSKERLLDESLDVGAAVARYGDMPSGGHSELNAVEAACERHMKARADIHSQKESLASIRGLLNKIDTAFAVVEYGIQDIVRDYYINGYSWEQISMRYHYSARWCREKSKKAVSDMAAVIFGLKSQPMQMAFVFAQ